MTMIRPAVHLLDWHRDDRGILRFGEVPTSLPFSVERFFIVDGVPTGDIRGDHAHRTCHQFLVCTRGVIFVDTASREREQSFKLDPDAGGLHIPPLVWATQRYLEPDSQLLVLASEPYSPEEYIRDRDEFARLAGRTEPQ